MLLLLIPIIANAEYERVIYPTDDAYIVADFMDPQDRLGLRTLNTGDFNFTKVWYAWNVTGRGEFIISFGMLKFDLSDVNPNDVISARLEMTAINVQLTGASREVVLYKGLSNAWSESKINFNNNPGYDNSSYVSTYVIPQAKTYSWDVTQWVKESAGGQLTLYVAFRTLYYGNEEQVVFVSRNYPDRKFQPKLVIETASPPPAQGLDQTTLLIIAGAIIAAALVGFLLYRVRRRGIERPAKKPARKRKKKAK